MSICSPHDGDDPGEDLAFLFDGNVPRMTGMILQVWKCDLYMEDVPRMTGMIRLFPRPPLR